MTGVSDSARPKSSSHSTAMTGTRTRRKLPGVRPPEITSGNPLQLMLSQRMRELGEKEQGIPLSYQQVVDRGKDKKGDRRFSKPTIGNILNGKTTRLTDGVIEGIAQALDLDADQVREAARQSAQIQMTLPARAQRLSPDQWQDLLWYMDSLLSRDKRR